ncbi:MAG: efflux transporter outer membrane subunit [Desulfobacterota bacterium]|nr:efflux transporter outer membrane subunit [Thermodesulfobacteriota bacterium]
MNNDFLKPYNSFMKEKNGLYILILLLVLCGCVVGPDYKKPDAKTPPVWDGMNAAAPDQKSTASMKSASFAQWWKIFNDPVLDGLVEKALAANLDLKIAEARIRQARAERIMTAAGLWPETDATGLYSRSHNGKSPDAPSQKVGGASGSDKTKTRGIRQDLYQAGFDASWEIDIFGGVRRSVEAADADIRSAVENYRDVMVSLVGEVGSIYLSLRGYQQRIIIAKKNLASQQYMVDITRKRFDAGFVSGLDVANAEAQAASTKSQIPFLESSARQAIYSLSVLLNKEPSALSQELSGEGAIPSLPQEIPVGLPSDLLRRRPDVRKAEAQLHAATARIGVAIADLFPKFILTGSYGLQDTEWNTLGHRENRIWSFGPSVQWPVFAAGRIRANIKVQNALQEQALAAYEKAVLTALRDTESALVSFEKEQEHNAALAQALDSARRAVDISIRQYTAGKTDFLNVLLAQRSLFSYEDALVQSTQAMATNLVALYKALGGGWEEAN